MIRNTPHRRIAAATLTASLLGITSACGGNDGRTTDSAGGTMASGDSSAMVAPPNNAGMMDQSVAGLLATVNRAEIESGTLAQQRARNADVKQYAAKMIEAHRSADSQLRTLAGVTGWTLPDSSSARIGAHSGMSKSTGDSAMGAASGTTAATGGGTNTTSPTTVQGSPNLDAMTGAMHASHMQAMETLRKATGAAFDRAYIDAQIAGHQQTLDLLRQHASSVQSAELRSFAQQLQGSVEQHLQEAQTLREKVR